MWLCHFHTSCREDCAKLESGLDEKYKKESEASLQNMKRIKEIEQSELRKDLEHRIDVLKQTVSKVHVICDDSDAGGTVM